MSRGKRNWILALILIPAAAYGVAKLAIWYSVKDGLDTAAESMEPFAAMEHSSIRSPVFGAFGVTGIRIRPHMVQDEITVGSALVHIDDPVEKYRFLSATLNDTVPTSFNFSLNDVRVPLDGDIAAWSDALAAMARSTSGASGACATGTGFSLADMRKIGYEELVANVIVDYAFDRRDRGLSTYLKLRVQDVFEMTVEGRIPASDVVFAVDRMSEPPRFSDLTLTLEDLDWASRFNGYCAGQLGISEAAYVDQRVEEARQAFVEAGFEPSAELLAGLKRFARGAASLTISLNPRDPIDPTKVQIGQDPEYLIDALGIEVMVDGTPIQSLGTAIMVAAEDEQQAQPSIEETFKPTPLAELPQYLKNSVRVHTADGNVHEGYLDSVDAQKIVLTQHLAGGSATFDVGRDNVQQVLVLRP